MSETIRVDENTVFNPETGELGILPEISVNANKQIISDDSPVVVQWTIQHAHKAWMNGEEIPVQGSKEILPTGELKLLFTAENRVGQNAVELIIPIDTAPPVITSFKADSNLAITGYPTTLRWRVQNAKKIEIDNSVGDVTGKDYITITTKSSGVFRLRAFSHFGFFSEAQTEVCIFPLPLVEGVIVPEPRFNFDKISSNQPQLFNSCHLDLKTDIHFPEFIPLDSIGSQVYIDSRGTNMGSKSFLTVLSELQREIINQINNLWRVRR